MSLSDPIPLYATPPDDIRHPGPECVENRDREQNARGLNRAITCVSNPGLWVYPAPADRRRDITVLVCPGGGFHHITLDKEGIDVAEWLNGIGVGAVVLKYRTRPDNVDRSAQEPFRTAVSADARRAVRLIRHNAKTWQLGTGRLGAIGFSAGADLSNRLAATADDGDPGASDPVERRSCRPDFLALLYTPKLSDGSVIDAAWPPTFLAHAGDDTTTPVTGALAVYAACLDASVRSELHVFPQGGHGFGLGVGRGAIDAWPSLFVKWLEG